MANNRMWLVHKPTGRKVLLGKRLAGNWYRSLNDADMGKCLDGILEQAFDDEFCLAMEDVSSATGAVDIDTIGP
jgi:hypothetical protein